MSVCLSPSVSILPLRDDAELSVFGYASDEEQNVLMPRLLQDGDFVAKGLHLRRRRICHVESFDGDVPVPIPWKTNGNFVLTDFSLRCYIDLNLLARSRGDQSNLTPLSHRF